MVKYVVPMDKDKELRKLFDPAYLKDKVEKCVEEVKVGQTKVLVNRCVKSSVQINLAVVPPVQYLVYDVDPELDKYFQSNKEDPLIKELLKYRVG